MVSSHMGLHLRNPHEEQTRSKRQPHSWQLVQSNQTYQTHKHIKRIKLINHPTLLLLLLLLPARVFADSGTGSPSEKRRGSRLFA